MIQSTRSRRGEPLVALTVILLGWVGVRVGMWALTAADQPVAQPKVPAQAQTGQGDDPVESALSPRADPPGKPADEPPQRPVTIVPVGPEVRPATTVPQPSIDARIAIGHQMLLQAGLAALPVPEESLAAGGFIRSPSPAVPLMAGRAALQSRWSGDAWVLWRQGGNGYNLPGRGLPGAILYSSAYGASQAGIVLRYRIDRESDRRPALYLRASSGYDRPRGEEVAAGLSLRPLPRLPLAAMAEVRATRVDQGTSFRPAAAVVTELPPASLPLGLQGELYGQAGWVGGKGQTMFLDGQARVDRGLARTGEGELRFGAGAWGGAQRGTHRVDLGPSLRLDQPLGGINTRLSADYRLRVAGSAAPGSGVAVTFSAGF